MLSSGLDFWTAGRAMAEHGKRITRASWYDKHMFVTRRNGYPSGVGIDPNTAAALRMQPGANVIFGAYAVMMANGSVVPWQATQADMFAKDWAILDG